MKKDSKTAKRLAELEEKLLPAIDAGTLIIRITGEAAANMFFYESAGGELNEISEAEYDRLAKKQLSQTTNIDIEVILPADFKM